MTACREQTILIVDDTPANLALAARMLEPLGARLSVAQGGMEALQRAALAPPDLILLDVMLPDLDGFEVCRRLKAGSGPLAKVPVIFMTALSGISDKVTGFAVGAVDYLTKPLQRAEMLARVSTHLELALMQTRLLEQNALLRRENEERRCAQQVLQQYRDSLELQVNARTAALRESERQFRTLSENLPEPIGRYDRTLACVYANPAYLQAMTSIAVCGPAPADGRALDPVSPLAPFYAMLNSVLESGRPAEVALRLNTATGAARHLALRAVAEYGADGQVVGALIIAHDTTEHKRIEQALTHSHAQLRGLGAHREGGREEERKQIARELHDELGQTLTALRLMMKLLPVRFGNEVPELAGYVKEMTALVDRTIGVVRGVVTSLRPAVLDLGIGSALGWLVEEFRRHNHALCRLVIRLDGHEPCESLAVALFRIVQESLTNVSRHASATQVQILLRVRGHDWDLQISDNGCGFDPAASRPLSFGLLGMHERVLSLGGRLRVVSCPGYGTRIVVGVPLGPDDCAGAGRGEALE